MQEETNSGVIDDLITESKSREANGFHGDSMDPVIKLETDLASLNLPFPVDAGSTCCEDESNCTTQSKSRIDLCYLLFN